MEQEGAPVEDYMVGDLVSYEREFTSQLGSLVSSTAYCVVRDKVRKDKDGDDEFEYGLSRFGDRIEMWADRGWFARNKVKKVTIYELLQSASQLSYEKAQVKECVGMLIKLV